MTTTQINHRNMIENARHNRVNEEQNALAFQETARANRANERLKDEANKISERSSVRSAQASIYGANASSSASRYAAKLNSDTSKRNTDVQALVSKYNTDVNRKLQESKLEIDRILAKAKSAQTISDIQRTQAEMRALATRVNTELKDYELRARQQNNNDALRKANIAQGWVHTATSGIRDITSAGKNVSDIQRNITSMGSDILKALGLLGAK